MTPRVTLIFPPLLFPLSALSGGSLATDPFADMTVLSADNVFLLASAAESPGVTLTSALRREPFALMFPVPFNAVEGTVSLIKPPRTPSVTLILPPPALSALSRGSLAIVPFADMAALSADDLFLLESVAELPGATLTSALRMELARMIFPVLLNVVEGRVSLVKPTRTPPVTLILTPPLLSALSGGSLDTDPSVETATLSADDVFLLESAAELPGVTLISALRMAPFALILFSVPLMAVERTVLLVGLAGTALPMSILTSFAPSTFCFVSSSTAAFVAVRALLANAAFLAALAAEWLGAVLTPVLRRDP